MRRIILVALAVAAVISGAIAISQAATTKHAAAPKTATHKHAKPWKHRRIAGVLVHRFSILRSARSAATATPLSVSDAEHFTEPGTEVAKLQLEPDQARSLDIDGTPAWVIPGGKGMFLLQVDPGEITEGAACSTASQAASEGIILVSREASGPSFIVYGLAPDGDSVTVANEEGSSIRVPVTSNFFKYSGGASARSISIRSAGGAAANTMKLVR
jgi:hypothetical protein